MKTSLQLHEEIRALLKKITLARQAEAEKGAGIALGDVKCETEMQTA